MRAAERIRDDTAVIVGGAWAKAAHFSRFTAVGAAGLIVNQGLFSLMASQAPTQYLLAAALATVGSTTFNFAGIEAWVFRGRSRPGFGGLARRFAAYGAVNGVALLVRLPLLFLVTSALGGNYLLANLITLAALTFARFALSDRLIWPGRRTIPAEAP
ncbi:MAG TPA: GtrA family protein [Candidatus Dormibacteraeota bacterium]|jgi:putative flippase GtrA